MESAQVVFRSWLAAGRERAVDVFWNDELQRSDTELGIYAGRQGSGTPV